MISLNLYGEIDELLCGAQIVGDRLGFELSGGGIPVELVKTKEQKITVSFSKNVGKIIYNQKIHFFRGLGLLVEHLASNQDFEITEKSYFDSNGIMIDVSQANALPKVKTIEQMIGYMAIMGLNMLMLYMEDSYVIEGESFFGYMRGKYTKEELKAIDDYADMFGIMVIPAIQTLSHLSEVLKWKNYSNISENNSTLLPDDANTYHLIDKMFESIAGCFRSNRVHIGMDEAWGLGKGKYYDLHGEVSVYDIMIKHLYKTVEIAKKYKMEPMIWGDMFFRDSSEGDIAYGNSFYTTANISKKLIEDMPNEVDLVFWEYNDTSEEYYIDAIKKHCLFGKFPIFAGGIWNWVGFAVNYGLTFKASSAGLSACKKTNVRNVFATLWGDDSTECPLFATLLGMQFYAEHGYCKNLEISKLKSRFEFCTGGNFDDFMATRLIDQVNSVPEYNEQMSNPSKYLLWQNVLLGLFDKNAQGLELEKYYHDLANVMKIAATRNGEFNTIFELYYRLCLALELKAEIGNNITCSYKEKDMQSLATIAKDTLPTLIKRMQNLRNSHRELWYQSNKAIGFEIIDTRYGSVISCLDTAKYRIDSYLDGKEKVLLELEEERIYFDGIKILPPIYHYKKIPSASRLSQ